MAGRYPDPIPASQSFAESFEAVGQMMKGGKAVAAVNKQGQLLLFSEDKNALSFAEYVGFQELKKGGGLQDRPKAQLIFDPYGKNLTPGAKAVKANLEAKGAYQDPYANWPWTAEKFTLPSIETKAALAEQKKTYEGELAKLKEKSAAAQGKGQELQLGVSAAQEESEELKALTESAREKLSQLALSETKIRQRLSDTSRGQLSARKGMTGGRQSLYSLSERGFEQRGFEPGPTSYSARGNQRSRERQLMFALPAISSGRAAEHPPAGEKAGPAQTGDFYREGPMPTDHVWKNFQGRPGYREAKNTGSLYYWGSSGVTPEYRSLIEMQSIPKFSYPGGEAAYNAEYARLSGLISEQESSGVRPRGFQFDPYTGKIR